LNLPDLIAPIADDMRAVDALIRARLHSEVVLIRTIGDYIVQAGGKRIRPAVLLTMARALGYQGKYHHLLAAVIECIHTATLLHDDVVDESALRRGRHTANAVFGNAASVLVGDYLYSRSFEMMVEVDSIRIMGILSGATTVIAEGEVLQLLNVHDPEVSQERYLQVVRYKTAKLFEAAAQVGGSGLELEIEIAAGAVAVVVGEFRLHVDAVVFIGVDLLPFLIGAGEAGAYLQHQQLALAPGGEYREFLLAEGFGLAAEGGVGEEALQVVVEGEGAIAAVAHHLGAFAVARELLH
jgi:octaprenyl-diphosphate synthase